MGALFANPVVAQTEGDAIFTYLELGRFEHAWSDGKDSIAWDAQGWIGGDFNKFWMKSEGTYLTEDSVEEAELQLLYSRLIAPFWDVQLGVRQDFRPRPSLTHGVIAFKGLAPYFFEIDASAFVSEDGDATARVEAEYELLFTQRLVLQPRIEINLSAQDIEERDIGAGVPELSIGLRLRYEIFREFAPYAGFEYRRGFGETSRFARRKGDEVDEWSILAGVRAWF